MINKIKDFYKSIQLALTIIMVRTFGKYKYTVYNHCYNVQKNKSIRVGFTNHVYSFRGKYYCIGVNDEPSEI